MIELEQVRCTKCNRKLAEIDFSAVMPNCGDFLYVKCPRCGELNVLNASERPAAIREKRVVAVIN